MEGFPDEFLVNQSFYSSPVVGGKFTGRFRERLENGSLVIEAGVNVRKHAGCTVTANLYSADQGTPLQHSHRLMVLDPSMKTITFTFFGKIFRDYGDQGVFRLQDLKAQCKNLPYPAEWFVDPVAHQAELEAFQANPPASRDEPSHIYFEYYTYSYVTRSYPNSAFSAAEWQSPEKTRLLEMQKILAKPADQAKAEPKPKAEKPDADKAAAAAKPKTPAKPRAAAAAKPKAPPKPKAEPAEKEGAE